MTPSQFYNKVITMAAQVQSNILSGSIRIPIDFYKTSPPPIPSGPTPYPGSSPMGSSTPIPTGQQPQSSFFPAPLSSPLPPSSLGSSARPSSAQSISMSFSQSSM